MKKTFLTLLCVASLAAVPGCCWRRCAEPCETPCEKPCAKPCRKRCPTSCNSGSCSAKEHVYMQEEMD